MPRDGAERHYPCEACGADLRFAPGADRLVCDHCGHVQPIPAAVGRGTANLREIALAEGLSLSLPAAEVEELRALSCPNCGALIEVRDEVHAAECPFCATPVVMGTGTHRLIKPQGLLPFVLTEAAARDALSAWLGRLWFAPSGVADYARKGRAMRGVYAPFWTFDADTQSRYRGQRGDAYTETRSRTVSRNGKTERVQEQVRKIRWTRVSGEVSRVFDDVLILGSESLPRGHAEALQPWDLSALVPYAPDYLAGFEAEGYTVALPDAHARGREAMERVILTDVRRAIGGDEQRVDEIATDWSDETFKHVLLPIWTAAYRFRGKSYRFVVNGQTGAVRGERPWSWVKITLAVLAAAIALGLVVWFGQEAR